MKTYNRKIRLYFKDHQSRESAIDFLLKINIPFTYMKAIPFVDVKPTDYKRHHLDLYLTDIIATICRFQYRRA